MTGFFEERTIIVPMTDPYVCHIKGVPFTINIPQMLASIYHTYGSVMGYIMFVPNVADVRYPKCHGPQSQNANKKSMKLSIEPTCFYRKTVTFHR